MSSKESKQAIKWILKDSLEERYDNIIVRTHGLFPDKGYYGSILFDVFYRFDDIKIGHSYVFIDNQAMSKKPVFEIQSFYPLEKLLKKKETDNPDEQMLKRNKIGLFALEKMMNCFDGKDNYRFTINGTTWDGERFFYSLFDENMINNQNYMVADVRRILGMKVGKYISHK